MSTTQFISVRETAQLLAISEKKVMDLIEQRKLQAYRIADKFLRLKKMDVLQLRNAGSVEKEIKPLAYTTGERLSDFFYFNDFYLISFFTVLMLLYIIFYT
ncbi:MAG TPA: helix-turn-helix domain-containing protein [Candidatus Omnitrophota bacterium]|nr:helix-turn-helix domain-containing protein [Candidatus Omnitrophota bacterium]